MSKSDFPLGNVTCGGCERMVAPHIKHNDKWYCLRCYVYIVQTELATVTRQRDEAVELFEMGKLISLSPATDERKRKVTVWWEDIDKFLKELKTVMI